MTKERSNEPRNEEASRGGAMEIDWKRGVRCYFDVDGVTIDLWASYWNGREEVRVDGELVSSQRSLRMSTTHAFSWNGVDYELVVAWRKGRFVVTLYRDGVEIDSDEASMIGTGLTDSEGQLLWGRVARKIGPVFLASGLLGAAFGYFLGSLLK
ncbi:MAG: hypothetical protein P8102_14225 [Gammaproteobacteria bacterium]